jgi:hypothetical protein
VDFKAGNNILGQSQFYAIIYCRLSTKLRSISSCVLWVEKEETRKKNPRASLAQWNSSHVTTFYTRTNASVETGLSYNHEQISNVNLRAIHRLSNKLLLLSSSSFLVTDFFLPWYFSP